MKKLIAVTLSFILSFSAAACSNAAPASISAPGNETSVSKSETTASSTVTSTVTSSENKETETGKPAEEPAKDDHGADLALINAFLEGTGKALVEEETETFAPGEQTLFELVSKHAPFLDIYSSLGFMPETIEYCITDFGADGEPELLIKANYDELSTMMIPLENYMVFKPMDGVLKLTDSRVGYYRSSCLINKYGYVSQGGSSSAFDYETELGFINREGRYEQVVQIVGYNGLESATIPNAILLYPSGDIYETPIPDGTGDITCLSYRFGSSVYESDFDNYDAYLKTFKRTFFENDEGVMPSEDYLELCRNFGYEVVDYSVFSGELEEGFKVSGLTAEMRDPAAETEFSKVELSGPINDATEAFACFRDLINDSAEIIVEDFYEVQDGTYSYTALADEFGGYFAENNIGHIFGGAEYAFTDVGLDGRPEMIIKYSFKYSEEDTLPTEVYVSLRYDGGSLKAFDHTINYDTSFLAFDKQGGLAVGFYEGGGVSGYSYYTYDEDYEVRQIYSINSYEMLMEPRFPLYCLSNTLNEALDVKDVELGGEYTLYAFYPGDNPPYEEDREYEAYYTDLCKARLYVFEDENGDEVLDRDYMELCVKNGIEIVTYDRMDKVLTEAVESYGMSTLLTSDHEVIFNSFIWDY